MIYKNTLPTHKMYEWVFDKYKKVYSGRQEELKQQKTTKKLKQFYLKRLRVPTTFLTEKKSYMT